MILTSGWPRAGLFSALRHDVSAGIRQLRRSPAFALVAGATLAVGIGGSTAMFSLVRAYLLRPLPFPEADRLVWILGGPDHELRQPPPALRNVDWTSVDSVFEHTVAWDLDGFTIVGSSASEYVDGAWVSPGYFTALGQ